MIVSGSIGMQASIFPSPWIGLHQKCNPWVNDAEFIIDIIFRMAGQGSRIDSYPSAELDCQNSWYSKAFYVYTVIKCQNCSKRQVALQYMESLIVFSTTSVFYEWWVKPSMVLSECISETVMFHCREYYWWPLVVTRSKRLGFKKPYSKITSSIFLNTFV